MSHSIDGQFLQRASSRLERDPQRTGAAGRLTMSYDTVAVEHEACGTKVEALTRRDGLVGFDGHPAEREIDDLSGRAQAAAGQFDIGAYRVAEVPPLVFTLTEVTPTSGGARDKQSCHKSAV